MSAVTPWRTLFWRNLTVALTLLLGFKLTEIWENALGTDAGSANPALFAKIPLLLGYDVLGAAAVATIAGLLCWLFRRRIGPHGQIALSMLVQTFHGFLAMVSFYTTRIVGGPLSKSLIDLATYQDAAAPGTTGAKPALASSIGRYVGVQTFTVLGLTLLIGLAGPYWISRRPALAARARRGLQILATALFVTTAFFLPWLINGEIAGIRVHTFGLERSPGVELVASYIRPVLARLSPDSAVEGDPFRFDLTGSAAPEDQRGPMQNPVRQAAPKPTNVILVSLESVGGVYLDAEPTRMPFISGIGAQNGGVYFAEHSSVWPQTMKAFFSLFCAELPNPSYETISMVNPAIPCVSLSEALSHAGYFTALVTSADLAYDRKMRFFQHRAFDHVVDMHSLPDRENYWSNSWGVDEKAAVAHILKLASEPRGKPFFVFYELFTAHHPYDACQDDVDHPLGDDRAAYLRALRYIDDRMRDLWEGLKAEGHDKDTLVVFVADHGEGFSQHPGSVSHGPKIYEEAVHVPLAMIGPQFDAVSGHVTLETSHIDIPPTILGLVGLPVPCTMKGRDLVHSSESRIQLFGGRPPGGQMGLREGKWKYILNDSGQEEVYDLAADPAEQNDLAGSMGARMPAWHERITHWRKHSEQLISDYAAILSGSGCRP